MSFDKFEKNHSNSNSCSFWFNNSILTQDDSETLNWSKVLVFGMAGSVLGATFGAILGVVGVGIGAGVGAAIGAGASFLIGALIGILFELDRLGYFDFIKEIETQPTASTYAPHDSL